MISSLTMHLRLSHLKPNNLYYTCTRRVSYRYYWITGYAPLRMFKSRLSEISSGAEQGLKFDKTLLNFDQLCNALYMTYIVHYIADKIIICFISSKGSDVHLKGSEKVQWPAIIFCPDVASGVCS